MTSHSDHIDGRHRFGWYRSKPGATMDIHVIDPPLDQESWNEFRRYTEVVGRVRPFLINYLSLVGDFTSVTNVEEEIGRSLSSVLAEGMISIPVGVDANSRAQQLTSNFLTAASAFRDRAISRISREYGNNSLQLQAFKVTASTFFDLSFAYRSMYALRNHAQHHELPLTFVAISADRTPGGTMVARTEIGFHPKALATSHRVNSKVRAELRELAEDPIYLMPMLAEYMLAHKALMLQILEMYDCPLNEMAQYAAVFYRTFEIPHDVVPVIWEGGDPADGPHTQNRCIMCGFDEMLRAFQLRDELRAATAATKFCVSSPSPHRSPSD